MFLCAQQRSTLKKNAFIIGHVFDEKKNPIGAHIEVIDYQTKELTEQSEGKSTGDFRISVSPKNSYIVFISKPDYLFQSLIVSIPDSGKYEKKIADIILQKMEVGKKTVLNNISFDNDQAIILDESRPDLDRLIALLNDMPNLQVEFSGYTDKIGSDHFNRHLSEQRAKSVVDILLNSGIDNTRLKFKGYGPADPIASNFTEEGRQLNNRIELKVLKLDLIPKKESDSKQKKGILNLNLKKKENINPKNEEEKAVEDSTYEYEDEVADTVDSKVEYAKLPSVDSLSRIDYKGKFIADKAPLAFSTVNLLGDNGQIFKTTTTDENGSFQFTNIDADQEVTFGLDQKETKNFKKIFLEDTTGVVVKELSKVNGEFVLALLPFEKTKLGKVYLVDPVLKGLKTKSKKAFITGRVIDENKNPIKVQIEVIDNSTNETIEKSQSNSEGRYNISLAAGKSYNVAFNKSGYLFQSISVEVPDSSGIEKTIDDVTLQKVEVGKKIVLNNIFFDSNESTLRPESFSELERAVKLMNDMASLQIEISGHTDNVGSAKSNLQLSEQRAKAVTDFLISKGCDKNRLKYKGYGSIQPIATNNTEAGRQQNRRTEFKVLKVDLSAEQIVTQNEVKEDVGSGNNQNEEQKKNNSNTLPENFKKYDKDLNGIISYSEVMLAIDSFFENNPQPKGDKKATDSITSLLDFYFEQ